jgi:hypothetical protein
MYIIDLCNDDEFFDIEGIASFAKKMIKIKNDSSEKDFQIDIYAYQIVITSTNCNCYSEESFFCYAYYQEHIAE